MLAGLLALIPTKDWFYGALVIGLAVLGWHFYDKYETAVNYVATVKTESAAALATANKTIADNKADYATNLQKVQDNAAAQVAANNAANALTVSRLLTAAAARQANPVLQGASGTAAEAAAWASIVGRLERISQGLAAAVRNDDLAANECWAERDSLTGK